MKIIDNCGCDRWAEVLAKGTIHCEESTLFSGACFAIDFITGDDINGPGMSSTVYLGKTL